MHADSDRPTAAQGARGMLILDGAGHYFELVDRTVPAALATDLSEAQLRFYRVSGSWGHYEADRARGRIAFEAFAGRSANQTGAKFSRTFTIAPVPDDQDLLTTMSQPGELHPQGLGPRQSRERLGNGNGDSQPALGILERRRHAIREGIRDLTSFHRDRNRLHRHGTISTPDGAQRKVPAGTTCPTLSNTSAFAATSSGRSMAGCGSV